MLLQLSALTDCQQIRVVSEELLRVADSIFAVAWGAGMDSLNFSIRLLARDVQLAKESFSK